MQHKTVSTGAVDLILRNELANLVYAWPAINPDPISKFAHQFCVNFDKSQIEQLGKLLQNTLIDSSNLTAVKDLLNACMEEYKDSPHTPKSLQTLFDKTLMELTQIQLKTSEKDRNEINKAKELQGTVTKAWDSIRDFFPQGEKIKRKYEQRS